MDKKKLIRTGVLLLIPFFLIIFFLNGPNFVTIESAPGATISITDGKDGTFKKIGTTKVTRLFFKKSPHLYMSAELDGKQTINSIKLGWFSRQSVKLELTNTVSAQKISDGAVMDAIFEGNQGQGIVYGENLLVNFATDASAQANPEFTGLPYITKIIWRDRNNFVYLSNEGIGQFTNGKNNSNTNIGTTLVGDVSVNSSDITDGGVPRIIDISQTLGKPLVLLSQTNIFTSTDLGSTLDAIVSFDSSGGETSIFTGQDSIFKVTLPELGHTHIEDSEEVDKKPQITLDEYAYNGEHKQTLILDDDSSVVSLVEKEGTLYVLTKAGLHTIKDNKTQKSNLYFATPADMILYKDQVVVLAKDGLWKISDNSSFQLLYKYDKYGIGLQNSMSVDPNNQLLFGTTPSNDSSASATFITSF